MIGLGRMGAAMAERLIESDYKVLGYDTEQTVLENSPKSITIFDSLEASIKSMSNPRTIWLMVPAKFVDDVLQNIIPHLQTGDKIIDGGNSFFKDSIRRHKELLDIGINFIDCGTSGGVSGARNGASLMVGGETAVVQEVEHVFTTLAATNSYGHVGGPGAGHFVKMVHNGIEYGMMGALAEGMNVLHEHKHDLAINIDNVLKPYQNGSVITSSLMNWLADSYTTPGYLDRIAGEVPKGETESEMEYLIEHESVAVLSAAVEQRKQTRTKPSHIGRLLSAMRNQFGGHKIIQTKNE